MGVALRQPTSRWSQLLKCRRVLLRGFVVKNFASEELPFHSIRDLFSRLGRLDHPLGSMGCWLQPFRAYGKQATKLCVWSMLPHRAAGVFLRTGSLYPIFHPTAKQASVILVQVKDRVMRHSAQFSFSDFNPRQVFTHEKESNELIMCK